LKHQAAPEEVSSCKKAVRSSPLLDVAISVLLLLSGCASQPDKTQDKPGAVGVQMQSNTLAGSLQYGLKF
jgi:uncharacterized protein YceK